MKKKWKKAGIGLAILAVLTLFAYYENHHLTVTRYSYALAKLDQGLDGFGIVCLSDIHNASFGKENKHLLTKVKELKPGIIVLTGDLVDANHTNLDCALALTQELTKISPVYYVTGNHELWLSENEQKQLFNGLKKQGVTILDNRTVEIHAGANDLFYLTGLDDANLGDGTLKGLIEQTGQKRLSLVLAHEPQYLELYAQAGADLVLSGHAHGGQFRIPGIGGLIAPDQGFFPKYTQGEHRSLSTTMIISRGLGNSVIPVRLNNDPEIVLVTLKKS